MKILSLLAVLSLVAHAWIGMWQVFTDYVTTRQMGPSASGLRLVLLQQYYCCVCVCDLGYPDFLGELIGRDHGRYNP
jgi:succinate dehydrogenase / fumarate reductase membrane anchor subunit